MKYEIKEENQKEIQRNNSKKQDFSKNSFFKEVIYLIIPSFITIISRKVIKLHKGTLKKSILNKNNVKFAKLF
jgi:hypothetical protein